MRTRARQHSNPTSPRWWVKKRKQKNKPAETTTQAETTNNETPAQATLNQEEPIQTSVIPETPIQEEPVHTQATPETSSQGESRPTAENQETPNQTLETNEATSGTTKKSLKESLEELYTNIKSAPNYSAKIEAFLRQYPLHSINKRITKKKFRRRRVLARFPFDVWMADLIEYPGLKWHNGNYKFVLLVVDVFTKMIYVEPMKRKLGENTAEAMEKILSRVEMPPVMLVTDRGREFYNTNFSNVMFSNDIRHFSTPSATKFKASVAERAIRTIKTKIERFMQHTNSKNWESILKTFVDNYNHTPHSAHKMRPVDVTSENRKLVFKRLYPKKSSVIKCKLKVGDKVRKIREKQEFEKGYTPNWSNEIYEIISVRQKNAVCWYKLADSSGDVLRGIWYYNQLNLVTPK